MTWWKFWARPCQRNRDRSGVEADRRLAEVKQQQPTVERITAEMEARHADQFAEAFIAAMRGDRR